jgi:ABC-type transporter Mla subunit MlaD
VRAVLGWPDEAVQVVADLPGRVAALLDEVERLIARVDATLDRVDEVAEEAGRVAARADEVAAGAGGVVARADATARVAGSVVDEVGATARGAQELLHLYRPAAERAAPLVQHFVDEFSAQELQALIRLVDQVPQFTAHMERDIMPVLAKLDQVGPDVHELLDVLKDVRLAIQGVPGFALFRRRGADKEEELADERPETPPPVDRGPAS